MTNAPMPPPMGREQDVGPRAPQVEEPRPEGHDPEDPHYRDGTEILARSQWQLFRRKFFRHKLAMGSLLFLLLVIFAAWNVNWLTPYAFDQPNVVMAGTPPTLEDRHFFGTDQIGRESQIALYKASLGL
jgi:ABC-type antimicrobial peptide transport system permease subunit